MSEGEKLFQLFISYLYMIVHPMIDVSFTSRFGGIVLV